jgi:acyl carrier protein
MIRLVALGSIETRLCGLLTEIVGQKNFSVDMPLFRGGLELDSMSAAAFIAAIEQDFAIVLAEEDLELSSLYSLQTLSQFVAQQLDLKIHN